MKKSPDIIPGSSPSEGWWSGFIDHNETYGRHVIDNFLNIIYKKIGLNAICMNFNICDIGAGNGDDFKKNPFPLARKIAIETNEECLEILMKESIDSIFPSLNIEKNPLPFELNSIDIFIANQILEHTKEIFWIMHQITQSLKIGGHLIIGVPNIVSFHNRILSIIGKHPTQFKSYSAHVRPFSKDDFLKFMEVCFPGGYELVDFAGSQFYPFSPTISKVLCKLFPNAAFSIFFLFKKVKPYTNEFLDHPVKAKLETPFYLGD